LSKDAGATLPRIHVVAGAIFDTERRVLLAERPAGKHMAGGWEFPGGKLEPAEAPCDALHRELQEELGIEVRQARPLIAYEHAYPERRVFLDLWVVTSYANEPRGLDGQALRWVKVSELRQAGILEADRPMIAALEAFDRTS
jgi:8-oxo-dGTP diphosphatase